MPKQDEPRQWLPEEWERIKSLVLAAQDGPKEGQAAWLREQGASPEVLTEVLRLLAASEDAGDFLSQPASQQHLGVHRLCPATIGGYPIVEQIGTGGSAIVYAALDQGLERQVAIKVLRATGSEVQKRFLWDAKAAAALQHPNVVVIHGTGVSDDGDYIVMERIKGTTLRELLSKGPLPFPTAVDYARQIADGLEAAHDAGIIHRDLKPGNVMVTERGLVKLLDFGLAKATVIPSADGPVTIQGYFAGTPAYASPEQAEGKKVDSRADIFAFGCVFYEMLTGRQAYAGDTAMAVLGRIVNDRAPRGPSGDSRADAIIQRCLQKDPEHRYQSVHELKAALSPLVGTRPRRRPILPALLCAAGLLSLVAAMVWFVRVSRAAPERFVLQRITSDAGFTGYPRLSRDGQFLAYASDRAGDGNLNLWTQRGNGDAARLTFGSSDDYAPAYSPDGNWLVYRSDRPGAAGLYEISSIGGTERLLVRGGRDGQYSPDGKRLAYWTGEAGASFSPGSARAFLMPSRGGPPEPFQPAMDAAAYPVWSPKGDQLLFLGRAYFKGESIVDWWIAPANGGTARPTGLMVPILHTMHLKRPAEASWISPAAWLDGDRILFSASNGDSTNIWSLQLGATRTVADYPKRWTSGTSTETYPSLVEGGERPATLVYATLNVSTEILKIPLSDRAGEIQEPQRLVAGYPALGSPSVDADGRRMIFTSADTTGETIRMRVDGVKVDTVVTKLEPGTTANAVLSHNGRAIAYWVSGRGYSVVLPDGQPERICDPCGPPTYISDDGREILFESASGPDTLLRSFNRQRLRPALQPPTGLEETAGTYSPDHRWLAFSGGRAGLRQRRIMIASGTESPRNPGEIIEVTDGASSDQGPAWSPDGKRLYFLSDRDGSECVWAVDVISSTGHAGGAPFPVAHFHHARQVIRGPRTYIGAVGLSVASSFLTVTVANTTGNIWRHATLPDKR